MQLESYHLWPERCGNLSFLQFLPVDAAEEGVALDLSLSDAWLTAESPRGVLGQKLREREGSERGFLVRN